MLNKYSAILTKLSEKPKNLLIITDAGRDHDDELALAATRGLEKLGYIRPLA